MRATGRYIPLDQVENYLAQGWLIVDDLTDVKDHSEVLMTPPTRRDVLRVASVSSRWRDPAIG